MRSAILKSVLSVALCSIVAMLAMPCQAKTAKDGKYNPVSALAKDQNPLRWQQQLKWTAGAYELEYPELKLLGWREVGVLNNQKDIDEFIAGNVDKDKLYSHIIDYKNKKYEIAPLSQLAKKYDVWKNANFDSAKRAYGDKLVGVKVVELQWQYKGKKFVEKIAVTDKHDEVCEFIHTKLHRGATVSSCEGSFTHEEKKMIITVLNRTQASISCFMPKSISLSSIPSLFAKARLRITPRE